jgi:hypothetical protein
MIINDQLSFSDVEGDSLHVSKQSHCIPSPPDDPFAQLHLESVSYPEDGSGNVAAVTISLNRDDALALAAFIREKFGCAS